MISYTSRRQHGSVLLCTVAAALLPAVATAAPRTWNGTTSTDFWLNGNWVGGTAPVSDLTTDTGVFAGTVTANQPQLTASGSITGLSFTTTGGGWTLGSNNSANLLTLGTSGITTAGQTSGTNTISANLAIGGTQTWQIGTGGTLRIAGRVLQGSAGSPSASAFTIGAGSNNGTVMFDPSAGNNLAIYSTAANQALTINKATAFGSGLNTSSGTNVISHATGGGISVANGGSLTVNSGLWQTNDIGRNSGSAMAGDVRIYGGTLAAGGGRYLLTVNGTAVGSWIVDGGTLKITGSSVISNGASFQLEGAGSGTTSSPVANFNLKSGLVDVAKGVGSNNQIGAIAVATATPPSVLMNQTGGVAQFGVTTGADVFTGVTNANTLNNLYIGSVGGSGTGVKAAYTLSSGRLLVAGSLQGNAPAAGSNGVSNFNFMGGTLTVGTITATNLGSSGTATATSNQATSSDNVGTFVNYGGILAPGGDALSFTSDTYGNSSITATPVSGKTSISGNYVVSNANSALAVNISGNTASTAFQDSANSGKFSTVAINGTGTNTLGGNLFVNLINGTAGTTFAPTGAQTFKIMTFTGAGATNSGTFSGNNVAGGKVIATDGLTAFAITYDYTASTGGVTLGSGTANEWRGATSADWNTAGNWTAMAANTSAFIARFADQASAAGANSVNLANNLTIQGIQFSSASRQYTLSSSNGSGLTLDASPRNTTNLMTNAATAATTQITDSSNGAGSHTIGVPLTLASDLAVIVNNNASSVTISGGMSGVGRSITKTGSGTLVLSGTNTYSGTTTVSTGALSISSTDALPGWNTNGRFSVASGAILAVGNAVSDGSVATILGTTNLAANARVGFDTSAGDRTSSTAIADTSNGSLALVKLGPNVLTLSGSNSYTGVTSINAGILSLGTSSALAGGGNIAFSGGSLRFSASNTQDYSGRIKSSGSAVSIDTNSQPVTFGSALDSTNTGGLAKLGAGTLTLATGNAYTGATSINAGVLALGDANALAGGGNITFGGGTLQFSANNSQDYSARLKSSGSAIAIDTNSQSFTFGSTIDNTNTGGLTKLGTGTLTLSGSNTFTGVTSISAGILALGTSSALAGGGNIAFGGGTLQFSAGNTQDYSSRIKSSGAAIALDTNSQTVTFGTSIDNTNSGGLTKLGVGTLTLSGSNTYTGVTSVNAGILALGTSSALAGGGTITFSGGTLQFSAGNTQDYSGRIKSSASAIVIDTNARPVTFGSTIDNTNIGGLTKLGSGTLTLSGSNAYTGTTSINAGVLALGNAGALAGGGNITFAGGTLQFSASNTQDYASAIKSSSSAISLDTGSQTVTFGSGIDSTNTAGLAKLGSGTLVLAGGNTYGGTTTISAGRLTLGNGGSSGSVAGSITNAGALAFNRSDAFVFANAVSGTGSVVQLGNGAVTISGANSHTGGTQVGVTSTETGTGSIVVQGDQSAANGGWLIGTNSPVVHTVTFDVGSAIAIAAGKSMQVGSTSSQTAALQALVMQGSGTNAGSLYVGRNGTLTMNSGASWNQSGLFTVQSQGGNTATLVSVKNGATLTYTGTSTIRVNGAVDGSGYATLEVAGGTLVTGRGFEQTIVSSSTGYGRVLMSGSGTLRLTDNIAALSSGTAASVRFELGAGGGKIDTNGFDTTLSVGISGSGGLTKLGSGRLSLGGTNSYSGPTTIEAGTLGLLASNLLADTTAVTITNGGLDLAANSDSVASFVITSGSLAGTGKLTAATYVLGGGSVAANLGGNTLSVTGNTSLYGTSDATVVNLNTGTVTLGSGGRFTAATVAVTGSSGAGLVLGGDEAFGSLAGAASIDLVSSSLTVGAANTSTSYSGVFSGNGSLTKVGSGTFTFVGSSTSTRPTTLSGGRFALGDGGTAGSMAGPIVNNASLSFNRSDAFVFANAISGTGSVIQFGNGPLTISGSNSYTGGTQVGVSTADTGTGSILVQGDQSAASGGWLIGTSSTVARTVTFDVGSTIAVAAGKSLQVGSSLGQTQAIQTLVIQGSGSNAGTFYVGRGGAVTMNAGANWTQSGSFTVQSSGGNYLPTVSVRSGATLTYDGTSTIQINGAPSNNGTATLEIAGGTLVTRRGFEQTTTPNTGYGRLLVSGSGTVRLTDNIAALSSGAAAPVRFELGSGGGRIDTNGFDTALSVGITGAGGLRKAGTGSLTLSGSNTYSGATSVDAGRLVVNGALGSGTLTVASGASLGGSGTIAGRTVVNGIYAPGNSPGVLTQTAGIDLNGTSTTVWELWSNTDAANARGSLYDGINLTGGALSIQAGATLQLDFGTAVTSTVDWTDPFWDASHTWTFVDVTGSGSWAGSLFDTLLVGTDSTGATLESKRSGASFSVGAAGGDLVIEYVIVPEPGVVVLAISGLVMACAAAVRRRAAR
ncbi:MAG: autotransporter-associated beta strand repeat-containing protein [Planctomycetia bacterium]